MIGATHRTRLGVALVALLFATGLIQSPRPAAGQANAGTTLGQSRYLTVVLSTEGTIQVYWAGTPANAQDWITVVPAGTPDTSYGAWTYTGGQRDGMYDFGRLDPGQYEARLYFDWPAGGYQVQDRASFVSRASQAVEGTLGESRYLGVYTQSEGLTDVAWHGTPGNLQDWVSVVHAGAPDDSYEGTWTYTGGQSDGITPLWKLDPGLYEARLYLDWPSGGYKVVDRVIFTVSNTP